MFPKLKSLRELKDIIVSASSEFGEDDDDVVMLKALMEKRLVEHGSSTHNVAGFVSGKVNVKVINGEDFKKTED